MKANLSATFRSALGDRSLRLNFALPRSPTWRRTPRSARAHQGPQATTPPSHGPPLDLSSHAPPQPPHEPLPPTAPRPDHAAPTLFSPVACPIFQLRQAWHTFRLRWEAIEDKPLVLVCAAAALTLLCFSPVLIGGTRRLPKPVLVALSYCAWFTWSYLLLRAGRGAFQALRSRSREKGKREADVSEPPPSQAAAAAGLATSHGGPEPASLGLGGSEAGGAGGVAQAGGKVEEKEEEKEEALKSSPDPKPEVWGGIAEVDPTHAVAASASRLGASLKARWDAIDNKPRALMLTAAAVAALYTSSVVLETVDRLPQPLPKAFGFVGLLYSAWFTRRYVLFKAGRDEFRALGKSSDASSQAEDAPQPQEEKERKGASAPEAGEAGGGGDADPGMGAVDHLVQDDELVGPHGASSRAQVLTAEQQEVWQPEGAGKAAAR